MVCKFEASDLGGGSTAFSKVLTACSAEVVMSVAYTVDPRYNGLRVQRTQAVAK